jgi:hypothetical protein
MLSSIWASQSFAGDVFASAGDFMPGGDDTIDDLVLADVSLIATHGRDKLPAATGPSMPVENWTRR